MESSQIQRQYGDSLMPSNHDDAVYDSALTLREITNRSSKHLHDQLERTGSGSLQPRDSISAASGLDTQDSADRVLVPRHEPPRFHELNIAELIKAAAEQDPGKHRHPDSQLQAPLPDMPERTKPTPHPTVLSMQAGYHAPVRNTRTTSVGEPTGHSSRDELLPAVRDATAAAAAAQLVGMSRRGTTDSDLKANGHAPRSGHTSTVSAARLHLNGDARSNAGVTTVTAPVRPQGGRPYEAFRGYQPPLSADPDNLSAWDTPRLEQLPVKLPEPRSIPHMGVAISNSADPACKAGSAYDSPRAAQARGPEGVVVEESADGKWPAHVMVVCNSNVGKFLLVKQTMVCTCKLCQNKAAKIGVPFVDMTPTEFERHSGTHYLALSLSNFISYLRCLWYAICTMCKVAKVVHNSAGHSSTCLLVAILRITALP